jgi:hypothetical protein
MEKGLKSAEAVNRLSEEYQRAEAAFREQNGKTAECVLDLCKVVYDASSSLSYEYLDMFRVKNGLQDKSTFSQFKTVGQQYPRLRPHAACLPASWYTLYHIARWDDASFTRAVEESRLHPMITQREIKELGPKKKTVSRQDFHITIQIVPDEEFAVDEAVAFQDALIAFLRAQHGKWSCVDPDIRRSKALDAALETPSSQSKAA